MLELIKKILARIFLVMLFVTAIRPNIVTTSIMLLLLFISMIVLFFENKKDNKLKDISQESE